MATFIIDDLIILGSELGHIKTNWVIRNSIDKNIIYDTVETATYGTLKLLRIPIYDESGNYLSNCDEIECEVKILVGDRWSEPFILTPSVF